MKFVKPRSADYTTPHAVRFKGSRYLTWTSSGVPCVPFGLNPNNGDLYQLNLNSDEPPRQIGVTRGSPLSLDFRIHLEKGGLIALGSHRLPHLKFLVAYYWTGVNKQRCQTESNCRRYVEIIPNTWRAENPSGVSPYICDPQI